MTDTDSHAPKILDLPIGLDATGTRKELVKVGRTHLEDAVPLTVGQEWSGYAGALDDAIADVQHATAGLLAVAMGGTALGTGLNAAGFGDQVAAKKGS